MPKRQRISVNYTATWMIYCKFTLILSSSKFYIIILSERCTNSSPKNCSLDGNYFNVTHLYCRLGYLNNNNKIYLPWEDIYDNFMWLSQFQFASHQRRLGAFDGHQCGASDRPPLHEGATGAH